EAASSVTAASETSVTTEAKTDIETSETTKSTEVLTVSPSGYILDPNVTLEEYEYADLFPENQPCFIDETAEGVRVYGVNTDTEREFHYLNPFEEYFSTKYCVVLEHDGIADEFAGCWSERFGTAMSVYSDDYDGDGEKEIATLRYDTGGSSCRVMELVLYKLNEGHYEQFVFYPQDFNNDYIAVDIDSENKALTVSAKGFDKKFTYEFPEAVPPEMTEFEVNLVQVNNFVLDGGEITYIVTPLLSEYSYHAFVDICFRLKFSNGEFTCSEAEFTETSLHSGDYDGDGEEETAEIRYSVGGTWSRVMRVEVYKWYGYDNYDRYVFDPKAFNDKYINADINSEKRELTISIKGKTFTYDFSKDVSPEAECTVDMIQSSSFNFDDEKINYIITPLIGTGNELSEMPVDICFNLKLSDGELTCSDVEFTER
ncbi:MAG: hypothetical protein K2K44_05050, partial [Oscillospiraceae bacterium]|nr:hypothetical protein [Oscillospiraceae bacterium]